MTVVIIWEGASVGCTLLGCIIQKRKEISILWYRLLSFEKISHEKFYEYSNAMDRKFHRILLPSLLVTIEMTLNYKTTGPFASYIHR